MRINISLGREYTDRPFTGEHGLYSAVEPTRESYSAIEELFERSGLKHLEEDIHCTLMYSVSAVPKDHKAIYKFSSKEYRAEALRFSWNPGWDKRGLIILYLDSATLTKEHDRLESLGCQSYSQAYMPHITLSKGYVFKDEVAKENRLKYANRMLRDNPLTLRFEKQSIQDIAQTWDQRKK